MNHSRINKQHIVLQLIVWLSALGSGIVAVILLLDHRWLAVVLVTLNTLGLMYMWLRR